MVERKGYSPLMAVAAIFVIVFCAVGIGSTMGWIPTSHPAPENSLARSKSGTDDPARDTAAKCVDCGTVESIQIVSTQGNPSGIGAISGGVVGGILGHQIGGGTGKDLATIGGAVGGAYLGNEVEKGTKQHTSFRIVVRMDDGTHRTLHSNSQNFAAGQKVKVINGRIISVSSS